jgi:hypothetical protein
MNDGKKPVSNKPVQVSNAPPPITPLRGGGYIPKPGTNDRLPRWNKWRLMPEVKIWEAVALSLNIEPEKIETDRIGWTEGGHPFDESDDFNDRLKILRKHASNQTHFPTPCSLNMGSWHLGEKRLDEFAAWCSHVGFEIPPELSALAKAAPQTAPMVEVRPAKPEAVPVTSPSGDGWITKALAIAGDISLKKWKAGMREITARNISDALATELSKDSTTHGKRGPRSSGGVRNFALKGWKFTPPTGTSGTNE